MTNKEFFDKVVEMRKLQKAYFAKRDAAVLTQCKAVEREIDAEIKRVEEPKQLKLF